MENEILVEENDDIPTDKQEAEARIDINPDKTSAVLYLRKGGAGARSLEMKAVLQVLKKSDFRDHDVEKLKTEVQAFLHGEETELKYVLAEGIPSTRGKDREITIQVTPLPAEAAKQVFTRIKDWYERDVSISKEFVPTKETRLALVKKSELIASVSEGSEGEAGKDIYGNVIPGLPGNDPYIKISQGLLFNDSKITASQEGLLIFEAAGKSFSGELIDYRDAKVGIVITEDAMAAKANFIGEEGAGITLSLENIKKVLMVLGVKKGIEWEEVEKACAKVRTNGSVYDHVIARGEKPIAPGGSSFKWLVTFDPPNGNTVQIKAGNAILEISEPLAEGRPGYDVKGNELPVDKGILFKIEHDESVKEAPFEKGKRLIASRSGELCFDGKALKIISTKTVNGDVTEDIIFPGEIHISGNVRPGCKVEGGSHVTVDGLAEEAFIFAAGKAVVARGFKGGGKGILKARAGVTSAFVERASVMAIGDVQLNKGSILSSIKTNEKLLVAEEDGKLQGGIYRARHGVEAADVGSEKGIVTEISFGQDYFLKDNIDSTEEEIVEAKLNLSKIEEKISEAKNKKLPLPEDTRTEKIRLVKLIEQLKLKVISLKEKFEQHFESELLIRGTVFPGVVIESHNKYYEVQHKRSRVIFYFDHESGSIKEKPID